MKRTMVLFGLAILILGAGTQSAFAQRFEVHPYAGGFFPGDWREDFEMKEDGIYGLKGGMFISDRLELEGNFGYINHFEFEDTDVRSRGLVWEFSPSINFFSSRFSRFVPYASVGVGGLTGWIGDLEDVADNSADSADISPVGGPALTLEDGDTFLQVSYGGGVKGINLWGPAGLRFDIRGRSMPNFFGNHLQWLETSGGLTFTWGER
jgi:hypothetical protein